MIDINELRRLAQAATPHVGHACKYRDAHWLREGHVDFENADLFIASERPQEDAAFYAAANPAAISELLDRLEATEKERDWNAERLEEAVEECTALRARVEQAENDTAHQKAFAASVLRVAEGWERKCRELRAKIEAMEQQEPVKHEFQGRDGVWYPFINQRHYENTAADGSWPIRALYALPGAQNVPTALLVAVADLIAQMEIVSRVGFVDTPDDKDSCAAFCVAEGSWLELMSAVESLASALAAAPEAKP